MISKDTVTDLIYTDTLFLPLIFFDISQNKPTQTNWKTDCTMWKVKGHSGTRRCHLTIPPVLSDKLILLGLIGCFSVCFLALFFFFSVLNMKARAYCRYYPEKLVRLVSKKLKVQSINQPQAVYYWLRGSENNKNNNEDNHPDWLTAVCVFEVHLLALRRSNVAQHSRQSH